MKMCKKYISNDIYKKYSGSFTGDWSLQLAAVISAKKMKGIFHPYGITVINGTLPDAKCELFSTVCQQ